VPAHIAHVTRAARNSLPRGILSHHRSAVMARALPLDSGQIVMSNITGKMQMGGVMQWRKLLFWRRQARM
jgi:hypothetical protein